MKIEIVSGVHSNKKTNENKFPAGRNTVVKIDGKKFTEINHISFEVSAEGIANWSISMKGASPTNRLIANWHFFKYSVKKLWRRMK